MNLRLLDELVKAYAPQQRGRDPFWRPAPADCWETVHLPSWSWQRDRTRDEQVWPVAVLDSNGAWLSAASSVQVAHGPLTRTGRRAYDPNVTGYWEVTMPPWNVDAVMPPWGTRDVMPGERLWLTATTMRLLVDLVADGALGPLEVRDSWTSETRCRLRVWTTEIQRRRLLTMEAGDHDAYDALKEAYSQAVTLMHVPGQSLVFRPDWSQSIRAQHAATQFRRTWAAFNAGRPPIGAGAVDELAFPAPAAAAWHAQWMELGASATVPVKIDLTGRMLGTMKLKRLWSADEWSTNESLGRAR